MPHQDSFHKKHPKLHLLQEHDLERHWISLKDQRVCLLCGEEFTGHEIRVRLQAGRPRFFCPNPLCRGELPFFAAGGNPLLSESVWRDWMKSPPCVPACPLMEEAPEPDSAEARELRRTGQHQEPIANG